MTRTLNLNLADHVVLRECLESHIAVSAVEMLPSAGTYLLCVTDDGAERARAALKNYLIEGHVDRFPFYHARTG